MVQLSQNGLFIYGRLARRSFLASLERFIFHVVGRVLTRATYSLSRCMDSPAVGKHLPEGMQQGRESLLHLRALRTNILDKRCNGNSAGCTDATPKDISAGPRKGIYRSND